MTVEEKVRAAQDSVRENAADRSTLWKQTMYQYLYAEGCRIPTDLPGELRRLAQRESDG